MDLAVGAMGSLLPKLIEVIKEEYKLQKTVKAAVQSFSAELDIMRGALTDLAAKPHDQLDERVKNWASEVKDLSYDMEDVIDSLLVRVVGREPNENQGRFKKIMAKMVKAFKKGKAKREIGTAVEDIKKQLQEVAIQHQRYQNTGVFNLAAATATTSDPGVAALNRDIKDIIGLEKARDEIIRKLNEGDHVSKKELKILSIVGFGGLGKTTLARVVYEAYTLQEFHYKAFVSVSRNPDLKKVFRDLIHTLNPGYYERLGGKYDMERPELIQELRKLLSTKRGRAGHGAMNKILRPVAASRR